MPKILHVLEFDPRTVHPVVSRCNKYAIPAARGCAPCYITVVGLHEVKIPGTEVPEGNLSQLQPFICKSSVNAPPSTSFTGTSAGTGPEGWTQPRDPFNEMQNAGLLLVQKSATKGTLPPVTITVSCLHSPNALCLQSPLLLAASTAPRCSASSHYYC